MNTPPAMDKLYMVDYMVSHLTCPLFVKDEVELRKFCNQGGFFPKTSSYCVLTVRFERWSPVFSDHTQWQEVIKHHFFLLSNMLGELLNRDNIAVVAEKDYQMVCLINCLEPWTVFCEKLRPMLLTVMEVLETEFDVSVTMALSALWDGLRTLPMAYSETQDALWYNDFLGKDQQILFYEQLSDETHPMIRSELTELDKKLISKLQLMDIAGVKYVLHEMIDREFIQSTPTVKILQVRLGGICCKILDVLEELKEKLGDPFYYHLNPGPRIAEAKSLSGLTAAMDEIFDAICQHQNAAPQEPKPQWVDKMSAYIEAHYTDESLGLTEVSSAFGITPSYATRVFKQYTGRGIYETIQHVRLTAAKALLHSDKTMKQIAETVGYTSFLSMNRAFKKYEGATPTQFKEQ